MDLMANEKRDHNITYLIGLVAIVAIVGLVISEGGIEGAPVYEIETADYQVGCEDTDPTNDFYKSGTASLGKLEYHDYCRNGNVYQFHCASSQQVRTMRSFECANGCLNGACLK
jgi:hypothetical protein